MMWGRTAAKRSAPISCISVILCVVVTCRDDVHIVSIWHRWYLETMWWVCRDDVYIVSIVAYREFRDDVVGVWRRCNGCVEAMWWVFRDDVHIVSTGGRNADL